MIIKSCRVLVLYIEKDEGQADCCIAIQKSIFDYIVKCLYDDRRYKFFGNVHKSFLPGGGLVLA